MNLRLVASEVLRRLASAVCLRQMITRAMSLYESAIFWATMGGALTVAGTTVVVAVQSNSQASTSLWSNGQLDVGVLVAIAGLLMLCRALLLYLADKRHVVDQHEPPDTDDLSAVGPAFVRMDPRDGGRVSDVAIEGNVMLVQPPDEPRHRSMSLQSPVHTPAAALYALSDRLDRLCRDLTVALNQSEHSKPQPVFTTRKSQDDMTAEFHRYTDAIRSHDAKMRQLFHEEFEVNVVAAYEQARGLGFDDSTIERYLPAVSVTPSPLILRQIAPRLGVLAIEIRQRADAVDRQA